MSNFQTQSSEIIPTMIVKQAQLFLNVLLSFIQIGQCALFPAKEEEIQQIDLFEEKQICQLASTKYSTSFDRK